MFASKSKLQKFQVSLQREKLIILSWPLFLMAIPCFFFFFLNKVKTNLELSAERNIFKFRRLLTLSMKIKDMKEENGHMRICG